MNNDFDISELLQNILDDKPSVATPPPIIVADTNTNKPAVALTNDEFFQSIMDDAPPGPMAVAALAEAGAEMVLADVSGDPTTQRVNMPIFKDTPDEETLPPVKIPVFTAEDFAATMDIRNYATLVTLNTSRWHAKVKDRQASKDAATASDADEGAFETRKKLLIGADTMLKTIHQAIDEARKAHYEMTLPWSTTSMHDTGRRVGGRLLPNTLFVEYTTVMAQKKQQMTDALNKFEPEYPNLVAIAKKKLGKRFDAREYPNVSSIRTHFDLSFDFQPIPKGDDFKGLPQAQLKALANKINDNTRLQAENAMQEVWMRLHDAVARMADRLGTPDSKFHDTLVQNVRDTVRLLAHLNVTADPKVEALRRKVDKHLCQHDAKELREKPVLRSSVGTHALSIIEEMNL